MPKSLSPPKATKPTRPATPLPRIEFRKIWLPMYSMLIFSTRPLAMMPVGATGERAPALAPLQIMRVIRKGLIRVSPARAMPMGARTTVVAMLPGPIADRTQGRMKKTTGSMPTLPPDPLTAHRASFSTAPLMVAMLKSMVAPTRIMNSRRGKNLLRSDTFRAPPVASAMTKAKAMHMTPTFFSVTQLITTAMISAIREITPRAFPPIALLRLVMSQPIRRPATTTINGIQ